jgi:hypothetical protein
MQVSDTLRQYRPAAYLSFASTSYSDLCALSLHASGALVMSALHLTSFALQLQGLPYRSYRSHRAETSSDCSGTLMVSAVQLRDTTPLASDVLMALLRSLGGASMLWSPP